VLQGLSQSILTFAWVLLDVDQEVMVYARVTLGLDQGVMASAWVFLRDQVVWALDQWFGVDYRFL
jgi:hypothetical protein